MSQLRSLRLGTLTATLLSISSVPGRAASLADNPDARFLVQTLDRNGESCVRIESSGGEVGALQAEIASCDDLPTAIRAPGLHTTKLESSKFRVFYKDTVVSSWTAVPSESGPLVVPLINLALEASRMKGYGARNFLRFDANTAKSSESVAELNLENYKELLALVHGTSTKYLKSASSGGAQLPRFSEAPKAPQAGQIWYDEQEKTIGYYDGQEIQFIPPRPKPPKCIQSITAGSGLTGGKITHTGTIALEVFGTPGTYYKVTTDVHGRVQKGASALVEADIPTLSAPGKVSGNAIVSGTIGGSTSVKTTGAVSATAVSAVTLSGQSVSIFNSSNSQKVTITAPASLTSDYRLVLPSTLPSEAGQVLVSDSAGNLSWTTMSHGSTGASVVISGQAPIVVSGPQQTPVISVTSATTSSPGVVQLGVLGAATPGTVVQSNDPRLTDGRAPAGAASGDLAGLYPGPTVVGIQNVSVNPTKPVDHQSLRYLSDSNSWSSAFLGVGDLRNSLGAVQFPGSCTPAQTLVYSPLTDQLSCANIAIPYTAVSGLGNSATRDVGVSAGTVAAGDDARFGNATQIQGRPVASTAPVSAQVLAWNESTNAWVPQTLPASPVTSVAGRTGDVVLAVSDIKGLGTSAVRDVAANGDANADQVVLGSDSRLTNGRAPTGAASGDLSGQYPAPSVAKIQGFAVSSAVPAANQVLTWIAGSNTWAPKELPAAPVTSVAGRTGAIVLNVNDIAGLGSAATYNVNIGGNASANQVVLGNDSRLNDGRSPVGSAGGDLTGTYPNPQLINKGTAGTYIKVTTDAQGRVISGSAKLIADDIPGLDWSKITSGWPSTLAGYHITDAVVNAGGTPSIQTGLDTAKGQPGVNGRLFVASDTLKIYTDNGSAWTVLASSTGAGGTVTSVTAGNGLLGGTITSSGTLSVNTGVGANQIVQLDGSAKLPAVDGSRLTALNASNLASGTVPAERLPALAGDVTSAAGGNVTSVSKIQGVTVDASNPVTGSLFKYNGTSWISSAVNLTDLKSRITGPLFSSPNCTAAQTLSWNPISDQFSCIPISLADSSISYSAQASNTFFAAPDGATGAPQFRKIVAADLPAGAYDASYFKNGGNAFGGSAVLGTQDSNTLAFATNGAARMTIDTSGNIGVGNARPQAVLDVNGAIKVGNDANCTPNKAGAIHWNGSAFEGCDGTKWGPLAAATTGATVPGYGYQINKTNAVYSGVISWGNNVPSNTDGTEVLVATITPKSANSLIEVNSLVHYSSKAGPYSSFTLAAFQNSAASAFATSAGNITTCAISLETSYLCQASLTTVFIAGTTDPIVIHIRAGQASGSWELNGSNGPKLGGTIGSTLTVREVLQ